MAHFTRTAATGEDIGIDKETLKLITNA